MVSISIYCNPQAVASTVLFILGIVMFGAGVALLIAFGIHVVQPYDYTKNFLPTVCNVTSASVSGEMTCSCSASCACDCTSSYPCLSMKVQYRTSEGQIRKHARLYENYLTLKKQTSEQEYCSIYTCGYDENDNRDRVIEYRDTHGRAGKRFICHYNPNNDIEVVRVKTEVNTVITTMTLALASLLLGIILAVFTWKKC